ncbi:MAG: MFS transporter [Clostridiales bacterium]|jgi:Na+/melibiose symporter-like transporter|nr:MFS transporter [Clostridiales bacterium]
MFLALFNTLFGLAVTVYISNFLVPKYDTMYDAGLFREMWLLIAIVSGVLSLVAVISIAPKDKTEYFGTGKAQRFRLKDYWDVLRNNRAIQMLVLAASTDKLGQLSKSSAVSIVMYGIIVGNFAISGGLNIYIALFGTTFAIIALGVVAPRIGLKKSMIAGSWGGIAVNALLILLWLFGDPKTLSLPGYTNGYGQDFSGVSFFTGASFLLAVVGTVFSALTANTVYPMTADCSDYEISRSGRYMPGLVGTIFSFVDKMVSSFAPLIAGLLFALIGFSKVLPDLSTPETAQLKYVGIFLSYGMLIFGFVCNLIAMKFYPLTKEKMSEVQEKIVRIKQGQTAENGGA